MVVLDSYIKLKFIFLCSLSRDSNLKWVCKKATLEYFVKCAGKYLPWCSIFHDVAILGLVNVIKNTAPLQVFPVNLAIFIRATIL